MSQINQIQPELLKQFSEYVAHKTGLHYPPDRWSDLQRGIESTARELGTDDSASCMQQLMSSSSSHYQLESLVANLTIGETYFFRDDQVFKVLANVIVPSLLREGRNNHLKIKIWSAACCTGEEPYSVAILLRELIPNIDDWNITLLATDINPRYLQKARRGIYGQWSFRNTPKRITEQYFHPALDNQLEIDDDIKQMVRFEALNLVDNTYPSYLNDINAMDIIFCRNVLMYLTPFQAEKIGHKLCRSQSEDGYLIVSPSELRCVPFPPYASIHSQGTILCRKSNLQALLNPADQLTAVQTPTIKAISHANPPLPKNRPFNRIEPDSQKPPIDSSSNTRKFSERVRSLADCGQLPEALKCCDEWIASDRCNADAHGLQAMILWEQGSIDLAVASLRRAIYLNPKFALAHFALGQIARIRGQGTEADRHLTNTFRLIDSSKPDVHSPEPAGSLRHVQAALCINQ